VATTKLLYPKYKLKKFADKTWGANKVYRNINYIHYFKQQNLK